MATKSEILFNRLTERDADIERLAEGYAEEGDKRTERLLLVLLGLLAMYDPYQVTRYSARRARVAQVIRKIREEIGSTYRGRFGLSSTELRKISDSERAAVLGWLRYAGARPKRPSGSSGALAIIEGQTIQEVWKGAEASVAARTTAIVRDFYRGGVRAPEEGLPTPTLAEQVRVYYAGPVKRITRYVVQASVAATTSAERTDVFDANDDILGELAWNTIRDSRTCARCAAMDGRRWQAGSHEPIGHDMPYRIPPLHGRCRCSLVALFEGENLPENESYQAWLADQPESVQKKVLGAERARRFADGEITDIRDLVDQTGRGLTLEELDAL